MRAVDVEILKELIAMPQCLSVTVGARWLLWAKFAKFAVLLGNLVITRQVQGYPVPVAALVLALKAPVGRGGRPILELLEEYGESC